MTFALMIYASRDKPVANARQEQATLSRHRTLQEESRKTGTLHAVAQLAPPPPKSAVQLGEEGFQITDGPYIEAKEWLIGFYLLECADEAEAQAKARQICTEHHTIDVRPVAWHTSE